MKNPRYLTKTLIPCSMSDLIWDNNAMAIYDAVEDAKDGNDLVKRLNALRRIKIRWTLDRETDQKVRLVGKDAFGNTKYFICWK